MQMLTVTKHVCRISVGFFQDILVPPHFMPVNAVLSKLGTAALYAGRCNAAYPTTAAPVLYIPYGWQCQPSLSQQSHPFAQSPSHSFAHSLSRSLAHAHTHTPSLPPSLVRAHTFFFFRMAQYGTRPLNYGSGKASTAMLKSGSV